MGKILSPKAHPHPQAWALCAAAMLLRLPLEGRELRQFVQLYSGENVPKETCFHEPEGDSWDLERLASEVSTALVVLQFRSLEGHGLKASWRNFQEVVNRRKTGLQLGKVLQFPYGWRRV